MRTHTLVAAIAVIFSVYFAEAHAQQNAIHAQAIADTERDSQGYNAFAWAIGGCLGGLAWRIRRSNTDLPFANFTDTNTDKTAYREST